MRRPIPVPRAPMVFSKNPVYNEATLGNHIDEAGFNEVVDVNNSGATTEASPVVEISNLDFVAAIHGAKKLRDDSAYVVSAAESVKL